MTNNDQTFTQKFQAQIDMIKAATSIAVGIGASHATQHVATWLPSFVAGNPQIMAALSTLFTVIPAMAVHMASNPLADVEVPQTMSLVQTKDMDRYILNVKKAVGDEAKFLKTRRLRYCISDPAMRALVMAWVESSFGLSRDTWFEIPALSADAGRVVRKITNSTEFSSPDDSGTYVASQPLTSFRPDWLVASASSKLNAGNHYMQRRRVHGCNRLWTRASAQPAVAMKRDALGEIALMQPRAVHKRKITVLWNSMWRSRRANKTTLDRVLEETPFLHHSADSSDANSRFMAHVPTGIVSDMTPKQVLDAVAQSGRGCIIDTTNVENRGSKQAILPVLKVGDSNDDADILWLAFQDDKVVACCNDTATISSWLLLFPQWILDLHGKCEQGRELASTEAEEQSAEARRQSVEKVAASSHVMDQEKTDVDTGLCSDLGSYTAKIDACGNFRPGLPRFYRMNIDTIDKAQAAVAELQRVKRFGHTCVPSDEAVKEKCISGLVTLLGGEVQYANHGFGDIVTSATRPLAVKAADVGRCLGTPVKERNPLAPASFGVYAVGPPGSGKSALTAAVAAELGFLGVLSIKSSQLLTNVDILAQLVSLAWYGLCIIEFDEFDHLIDSVRSLKSGGQSSEWQRKLNVLKRRMANANSLIDTDERSKTMTTLTREMDEHLCSQDSSNSTQQALLNIFDMALGTKIVIASSNKALDEGSNVNDWFIRALLRPGRLDKCYIGYLCRADVANMIVRFQIKVTAQAKEQLLELVQGVEFPENCITPAIVRNVSHKFRHVVKIVAVSLHSNARITASMSQLQKLATAVGLPQDGFDAAIAEARAVLTQDACMKLVSRIGQANFDTLSKTYGANVEDVPSETIERLEAEHARVLAKNRELDEQAAKNALAESAMPAFAMLPAFPATARVTKTKALRHKPVAAPSKDVCSQSDDSDDDDDEAKE